MQHRKTLMLVLTALFAALTAVGAFFKIPFALAAISLQFLFTAMAGILLGAGCEALGLDFDAVSKAFEPYCTKITTLTTAESFS